MNKSTTIAWSVTGNEAAQNVVGHPRVLRMPYCDSSSLNC